MKWDKEAKKRGARPDPKGVSPEKGGWTKDPPFLRRSKIGRGGSAPGFPSEQADYNLGGR